MKTPPWVHRETLHFAAACAIEQARDLREWVRGNVGVLEQARQSLALARAAALESLARSLRARARRRRAPDVGRSNPGAA